MFERLIGCSIREIRLLRIVADYPGTTFAEIVRATRIERSLTSRIIQRLLGLGLIERRSTPEDARRYRLFATELGREKRAASDRLTAAIETLFMSPLSHKEVDQLNHTLEKLAVWVRSDSYAQRLEEVERSLEKENRRSSASACPP
jgi:DNA-binding MarR family transcriptional regulator